VREKKLNSNTNDRKLKKIYEIKEEETENLMKRILKKKKKNK